MNNHYEIIVIGGGASGMMAAGRAASLGKRVLLLEKNSKLGQKLKITGGGRCNITNAEFDTNTFLSFYGKVKDFLYSPFSQFGVQDTFNFFESRDLPLVIQARGRTFPKTEKAIDVFKVMSNYITEAGVEVKTASVVSDLDIRGNKIKSVLAGDTKYSADRFILATGGLSHPETGSTGDGFSWLKKFGHDVSEPSPNIVPLLVSEKWVKNIAGVVLPDMKVTFYINGKKSFSKRGSLLFTHTGVSGPLILNSSAKVSDLLHEGDVTASIDLFPDMNHGELEKHILSVFDENKNKILKNVFADMSHSAIAKIVREHFGNELLQTKNHSIKKEQRKDLIQLLKAVKISIEGLMGYEKAVISDGGVYLSEIDTRTMRSKKVDNLFVTGDLLNIRRPSGGYSLQLCWTTGFVAGTHAATN